MIISRITSLLLRASELAFSVIVAGITGWYLHATDHYSAWSRGRYIYTAGLSILASLVLLIPFTASLMHWPLDLLLFVLWMVAFGLLEDVFAPFKFNIVMLLILAYSILSQWIAASATFQVGIGVVVGVEMKQVNTAPNFRRTLRFASWLVSSFWRAPC
jgi:hypothetical protein